MTTARSRRTAVSTRMVLGAATALGLSAAALAQPLTQNQVEDIVRTAVDRANVLGINATISVTDREGNILACVRMTDTTGGRTIPTTSVLNAGGRGGLDVGPLNAFYDAPANTIPLFVANTGGARVATSLTATTKAGTAAFLSTAGNAFTTRTAAFIIQSNFPPGIALQGSGPLYGVQFSQLPGSDFNRLPLGLSGDSGGVPLYDAAGQCRGGIGVECNDTPTAATGTYAVDTLRAIGVATREELIALAGQGTRHAPPAFIRADRILVAGIRLPYAYANPPTSPTFAAGASAAFLAAEEGAGRLVTLVAPTAAPASLFTQVPLTDPAGGPETTINGVRGATVEGYHAAGVLQTFAGVSVDPDAGGPVVAQNLTAVDAQRILFNAHSTNNRLRAMIRRDRPLISQVNVSVVDFDGNIIGYYRSNDAPVFGMDVSAQKARSALFFSRPDCATLLNAAENDHLFDPDGAGGATIYDKYTAASAVFGLNFDGAIAYGERTIGFLSRTNLPDAIFATRRGATPRGPLGAFGAFGAAFGANAAVTNNFSPFNSGIQTDLFLTNIARFLLTYGPGGGPNEAANLALFNTNRTGARPLATSPLGAGFAGVVPGRVSRGPALNAGDIDEPALGFPARTLANGLQIFPGGVPLYKLDATTNTAVLVGAVGVSGDGIEQDDQIAFGGAGGFVPLTVGDFQRLGTNVRRADFVVLSGVRFLRLPYVKFPRAPGAGL